MTDNMKLGFEYTIETVNKHTGEVMETEVGHNLVPEEGIEYLLNLLFKSGAQVTNWYIAPYEGAYTPAPTDTAATFAAAASESTMYAGSTRKSFTPGSIAGGSIDNSASRAEFEFTSDKTVYGGFISSSSAKGSSSGVLLSAIRFPSPKSVGPDTVLRITAGFSLASI